MRKKILLIIICLFSMFVFVNEGKADTSLSEGDGEHELLYDIEKMYFDNSGNMILEGWAFLHNYHNFGSDLNDASYDQMIVNTLHKKNVTVSIYFADSAGNRIAGGDFSIVQGHKIDGRTVDLTDWMCDRISNQCYDSSVYYDLGFKASINLKGLNIIDDSKDCYIWLDYKIRDSRGVERVASEGPKKISVAEGVYDSANVPDIIEIENLSNNVKQIAKNAHKLGPAGTFSSNCGGAGGTKWELGETYTFSSIIKKQAKCPVNSDGKSTEPITKYSYPSHLYKIGDYYAAAGWVVVSGEIKIKYKGDNAKYCSLLDSTGNNCDGSLSYSCGEMTAKDNNNHKVNVSITETANWSQGEFDDSGNFVENNKPFDKTVISGKGFKYGIKYTDTVVITLDTETRSYNGDTYDKAILENLFSNYYRGLKVSNFLISDASSWNYNDPEFNKGGTWKCDGANKKYDNGNTKLTITQSCYYKLKESAIKYHGKAGYPEVSYFDSVSSFSSLDYYASGKYYYIPLAYPTGKFEWDLNISELGTYKFIIGENNKVGYLNWKIDTSSNNYNACYVNVKKTNNPASNGDNCVGLGCEDKGDAKNNYLGIYMPVFRSIDYLNPFPNYSVYPDNWQAYDSSHKYLRVLQSYTRNSSKPVYVTKRNIKNTDIDYSNYTTYDDINAPGGDSNLLISKYFDIMNRKHCDWGIWNKECDK